MVIHILILHVLVFHSLHLSRIDASDVQSGLGRYINHLRKGWNLKPTVVYLDGIPRVAFIANETINIGDDLYYDYGERDREIIKANPWLLDYKNKGMSKFY